MGLEQLGWNEFFQRHFRECASEGEVPARVLLQEYDCYVISGEQGEVEGARLMSGLIGLRQPVPGDWVVSRGDRISAILPRQTCFSRQQAGKETGRQILAANIDVAFLVAGLDGDFNPRRIERYLLAAWESGAHPVIVLNKADLCADPAGRVAQVERVACGAPIVLLNALTGGVAEALGRYLSRGMTAALVGASGVGKSTIVNRLLGEETQTVNAVRQSDSRGRHTTTRRQLFALPQGWLLLDLPGIRELQPWNEETALDRAFADIQALAAECRFRDCRHSGEPGCAVARAVHQEKLPRERVESYAKLRREADYQTRRQDERAALEEKRRVKRLHRLMRDSPKH